MNRLISSGFSILITTATVGTIQSEIVMALPNKATLISQSSSSTLASGKFVTTEQSHPTKGTASIVQNGNKRHIKFSQGFTTAQGPDVLVILYRSKTVPVKLKRADYVTVAPLRSFNGAQQYVLPEKIKLDDFNAVAIWCRKFNVTFGYATLN